MKMLPDLDDLPGLAKPKPAAKLGPKFKFKMVGQDGNAFSIIGRFRRQAAEAGWSKEAIQMVTNEAMAGNYDHLLATFCKVTDAC